MDLKEITCEVFNENKTRSLDGLKSDRFVQNHFVKSYKSRFFLELMQNARDAIVFGGVKKGKIKAWLEGNVFCFANNGASFNREGVRSICFPAISSKQDKGMIGHKGIGFNSILEITEHPRVITGFGTFYFSNEKAAELIHQPAEFLPLFQFPIFDPASIAQLYPDLHQEGYTTIFQLPLDKKTDGQAALAQALEISGQDIIFLAAVADLQIEQHSKRIVDTEPLIRLETDGAPTFYRSYAHQFAFTPETIAGFDPDEQLQFSSDPTAEVKFLLETDASGRFLPAREAKFYLYYALDPFTGFTFSIHSFFWATLDRKRLSDDSPLNRALFKEIAAYYTGTFLEQVKQDFPASVLPILAYRREGNANLEPLYDELRSCWKEKAFIYHQAAGTYLKPGEVLLASRAEMELFRDGMLGDKYLLYMADQSLEQWLISECSAVKLDKTFISTY